MLNGSSVLAWIAGLGTVVGVLFAIRKLYQWLLPIRVEPSIRVVFDGSEPDEIRARIINRSREAQYIVRCQARSTYPLLTILRRHIRHPFVSPRLYPNIWFNASSFSLFDSGSLKLEPFEPIDLRHRLSNHPLSVFLSPMVQIEVQLSTGRVFRGRRLYVPERWRLHASTRVRQGERQHEPQEPENILRKKRTSVDEGKIRLIDHAFKHIQSQCIPQYDRYCDQTIGTWKHKLLEISVMQFSENCCENIQESSGRVNDLIKILNENKIYKDVYDQLIGIGDQHNHVIAKFRDFEEKIKRFPEKATAGLLGLVEDEGRDMCEAVGKYGQWLREKSEVLVKMRSDEVQL